MQTRAEDAEAGWGLEKARVREQVERLQQAHALREGEQRRAAGLQADLARWRGELERSMTELTRVREAHDKERETSSFEGEALRGERDAAVANLAGKETEVPPSHFRIYDSG